MRQKLYEDVLGKASKTTEDLNLSLKYLDYLVLSMRPTLVAQRLKHLPPMQETWVRSLGQKKSPGEGNGNPFQYSCLENPMEA